MQSNHPQSTSKPQGIWCKICGITSIADAQAAQASGADVVGLNFVESSPRYIDIDTAAQISRSIDLSCVALFVNPPAATVQAVIERCEIDFLQFHGEETPDFCRSFGKPYMKALRVREDLDIAAEIERFVDAWAILLDAYVADVHGGTGKRFDWRLWPEQTPVPLVVAGGLTPENVAQAIHQCQPFGVDVSGGIECIGADGEAIKGRKDHKKIKQFVDNARAVFNSV